MSSGTPAEPIQPDAPVTKTRMRRTSRWQSAHGAGLRRTDEPMSVTVISLTPDVGRCHHYDRSMSRWEPNARGRLEQAALALYGERGFEQVTVAEIAGRAGLTERTFFRHYADKREVLFWGQDALQELMVSTVASAPDSAAPIDA